MISEQRAVELVEAYLAEERLTWRWEGEAPELVVHRVEEHGVGWLAFWTTAEAARTPGTATTIHGHLLVDREDGSIHHVPAAGWDDECWQEDYLLHAKGVRPPSPLAAAVRALAREDGTVAALRHLRREAPRLGLREAKAYLAAVRDGAEPPEELASLARKERTWPPVPIERLTGPVPQGPHGG
ncbi:YrhB domain-containing protein [Kitasatospora sp. NPDC093806]|uniref:YrhB domain-containing protein n=1 Tax=Kitasatospora sp. NPDC093806 TaxID=3155075 RepID=UPI00343C4BE6